MLEAIGYACIYYSLKATQTNFGLISKKRNSKETSFTKDFAIFSTYTLQEKQLLKCM